jgi:hypothetical protein
MAVRFTIVEPKPAKAIWKSETFWTNLATFCLAVIPEVQAFSDGTFSPENQVVVTAVLVQATNVINLVLRIFAKGPVTRTFTMLKTGAKVLFGRKVV